ncbi:MAG: DUF2631 domain-containing protein [Pseudonocardiaceae bacterium]
MAVRPTGSTVEQDPPEHTSDTLARRHHGPHGVDPDQEPSVEWGWHGSFPRASRIAGWITAASMFLMLIGNHEGTTEDYYLVVLGVGLVAVLVGDHLHRRRKWRR